MKDSTSTGLRADVDLQISQENWGEARTALHELWRAERTSSAASFIITRFEKLRPFVPLVSCRLAILRSFTVEPAIPLLRAAAFLGGIDLTVYKGGFDNYAQQLLDPASDLYAFNSEVVILALQTRDALAAVWESYSDHPPAESESAALEFNQSLRQWLQVFRSRSNAHMLIHTFEKPTFPATGVLDQQTPDGQAAAIQLVNANLNALKQEISGISILDYDALIARCGRDKWHDERKWLVMRMPIAAENLPALAQEWLRFLHPLTGRIGKVLVTDLDNTLWGGVLGEDGVNGIRLSREYPGAAYLALQRALLDLHNRGILLAIASKNNEDEALRAIEEHAGMLLRRRHFAAVQINWNSKAESLRRIASELNVGLESLVFLDDNPVERQSVRLELPEVTVIELPGDPMVYARTVRECPLFERLSLSSEDRARATFYAQQQERRAFGTSHASLEEFYRSLEQKVQISHLGQANLARVAQLIQKTNQFNMTTRRHNAVELERFSADAGWRVYATQVSDRFGDNGLVGVCITHQVGEICEIDTFLLSCRVIGRTVEDAILHFLVEEARAHGANRLQGWFLPTRKNAPAENFYESRGFRAVEQNDSGTLWELDVAGASIECPAWIDLTTPCAARVEECAHA
jgi:FkbH-like protein